MNIKLVKKKEDVETWNSFIRNNSGSIFHQFKWLRILAKNSGTKFWPLMGFKGNELIYILPLFHSRKMLLDIVTSPPPGGSVPYLGPIIKTSSNRRSQVELTHKEIVKSIEKFIFGKLGKKPNIIKMQFGDIDVRPFIWEDFETEPIYNYEIELDKSIEEIQSSFSKSERHNLRKIIENKEISVSNGGLNELLNINNLVRGRYNQQNIRYDISDNYLSEIYAEYKEEIEVLVLTKKNIIVNGIILFKSGKKVGHWIGAINRGKQTGGEVTLLHWEAIKLSKLKGAKSYDLCGANTLHLCTYKSKLNPSLKLRFSIVKQDIVGNIINKIYKKIKNIS